MNVKKLPLVSVVVLSYNGGSLLSAALNSLEQQTYPRDRYELIVVDDGSTDNTAAVAAQYSDVHYIKLPTNQGISKARNAGLHAAHGDIYVAYDCDCQAEPEWLVNLIAGYDDGRAIGVGAQLVEPEPIRRLTTRYISMCDALFAPTTDVNQDMKRSPLQRLVDYIKIRVRSFVPDDQLREVSELYGASSSFLRSALLAVNGWDPDMTWIEDRDLSQRLHAAFPDKVLYIAPASKIVHERGETLRHYLMRPVKRGVANFNFHKRNHIAPPIFPFPILYFFLCIASLAISLLAAVICILLLPQLLYFWWPYKFLQRKQAVLFLFPYIQLLEETMVIIGLANGFVATLRGHDA